MLHIWYLEFIFGVIYIIPPNDNFFFAAMFAQFLAFYTYIRDKQGACLSLGSIFRDPLRDFRHSLLPFLPPNFLPIRAFIPSKPNSLLQKWKKCFMSEVWCLSYLCLNQLISSLGNGFYGLLLAWCLHSTTTFMLWFFSSCLVSFYYNHLFSPKWK